MGGIRKNECSGRPRTLFEVLDPAGNCPEYRNGFLRPEGFLALGKHPIIFRRYDFPYHPDPQRVRGYGQTVGKARAVDKQLAGFIIDVDLKVAIFSLHNTLQVHG